MITQRLPREYCGHSWITYFTPEEFDNFLAGLYFMDKEGVASVPLNDDMIKQLEDALSKEKQLLPSGPTPMGLTTTQKDQVQKMIENYAQRVEKRRLEIVKRFRENLGKLKEAQDGNPFDTSNVITQSDLADDDNTKY